MPKNNKERVPLPKKTVKRLIEDCLRRKGMKKQDLAALLHYKNVQSVSNALSENTDQLTMDVLANWCRVLEYPIEDLLAERPYADPKSVEYLLRKMERLEGKMDEIKDELKTLREDLPKLYE